MYTNLPNQYQTYYPTVGKSISSVQNIDSTSLLQIIMNSTDQPVADIYIREAVSRGLIPQKEYKAYSDFTDVRERTIYLNKMSQLAILAIHKLSDVPQRSVRVGKSFRKRRLDIGVAPSSNVTLDQSASFQFSPKEYYSQFPYRYYWDSWYGQPSFSNIYSNPLTSVSKAAYNPYIVQPPIASISFRR